jgi:hypothetical protein
MDPVVISLCSFVLIFGGALFGFYLASLINRMLAFNSTIEANPHWRFTIIIH